jgi:hypothetical protein
MTINGQFGDSGRNVQVIYPRADSHGQKVQSVRSGMARTDSAVGPSGFNCIS